jgi:thioredoxin 1
MRGFTVLDFGENWCGHCQAAKPHVEAALAARPDVTHIKVLDGRGKPLGRSFQVKLWPTLVMLKDGVEVNRVVRPTSIDAVATGLASLT